MAAELDKRLVVNPMVVVKPMPTGAIVMHTLTGECFELNRVGAEVWKEIERGGLSTGLDDVASIAAQIAKRYGVSEQTATTDVNQLIEQLLRQDIIRAPAA